MRLLVALWAVLAHILGCADVLHAGHQPLSRIAIERATAALVDSASINAHPTVLGLKVLLLPSPSLLQYHLSLAHSHFLELKTCLLLIVRVSAWDMVTWWCSRVRAVTGWSSSSRIRTPPTTTGSASSPLQVSGELCN